MNKIKPKQDPPKPRKKSPVKKAFNWLLNGEFLVKGGVSQMPFILFMASLFLFHIWWVYFSENTIRDISKKTKELHEAKSEYNTTISMEENQTQLSNVLKSTEELNLKNPNSSPEVLNEEK